MSQEPLTDAIQRYLRERSARSASRRTIRTATRSRTRTSSGRTRRLADLPAEEPGLERLEALLPRERPHVLAAAVALRDGQVVLERGVRLLEGVLELVALEDVVLRARRLLVSPLRVDGAADGPERPGLALDPDDDPFLVAGIVDAVEHPLREPAAVGRGRHDSTIQSRRAPPGQLSEEPLLVPLRQELDGGAGGRVPDAGARPGASRRRDPAGPLRPEPADASAAGAAARPSGRDPRARRARPRCGAPIRQQRAAPLVV